jgi:hypothetical protein
MKVNPLFIGIIGAFVGFIIAFFMFSGNNTCRVDRTLNPVDSLKAQHYFNHYWAYSEGAIPKRPKKIDSIFKRLDSADVYDLDAFHSDVNEFFKDEYRLTNLTLDLNMLEQINEAYDKLGQPKYLKLFMGDIKPQTPQFGFIAVGYDTTNIKHAGVVPPPETKSNGYTKEMYYLEGPVSPTCPYECDNEWPIEKPPTH